MTKQELEPYRKTFERMLKEDKQDKSICYYLDGKELKSPAEVKRTYNDSSVILETRDEKNWECKLKKTPRGGYSILTSTALTTFGRTMR
ncbi:hypothetical protein DSO57_1001623 [Entomophthora muscae]|uniref:Uncharacterized protein n=1 Tax=Entomophthora muscae TaxID=34485 RepID=A0ACC2S027_9FUNG|nr:hypothetical protein DSO57_1001623 [Entomophthora muscae]